MGWRLLTKPPYLQCDKISSFSSRICHLRKILLVVSYIDHLCFFFFFKFIYLFYYLFLAVLGLRFCARAFSSCSKRGPLFIVVRGPLTVAAPLVAEHRLQMRRLSSCGSRAQLLRGMWDLPRPGLEPVSPALAGRFSTTAPPGKPPTSAFEYQMVQVGEKKPPNIPKPAPSNRNIMRAIYVI